MIISLFCDKKHVEILNNVLKFTVLFWFIKYLIFTIVFVGHSEVLKTIN